MSGLAIPLSATSSTGPVLVIALDGPQATVITTEGAIAFVDTDTLLIDMRYDWSKQEWLDVSGEPDDEPSEDHGGEAVPGHLPEPDGVGGGDPGDGQDGAIGSVDTSEGTIE